MLHVITVSSYETSGSLLVTVFREQYCSLIVSLLPRTEGHVPPSAPVKAFHIYPTSPHVRTEGSSYRRSHLFFVAAGDQTTLASCDEEPTVYTERNGERRVGGGRSCHRLLTLGTGGVS